MPRTAVIVEFDEMLGGPPSLPPNRVLARFPLTLDQASEGTGTQDLMEYVIAVRLVEMDHLFTVRVWLGSDAADTDIQAARRVLGSILPSGPAVTPPSIPTVVPSGGPAGPVVTVTPGHGPVGTKVHLEGHGFTDPHWQSFNAPGGYGISILRAYENGCEAVAAADYTGHVDRQGWLVADFTVPSTYSCFQSSGVPGGVLPGEWRIIVDCHACEVGRFEVTTG